MSELDVVAPGSLDRRDFVKRAAVIAWSTPVIFTMLSRPAGAQAIECGGCPDCGFDLVPCEQPDPDVTCPTGTTCQGGELAGVGDGCACLP